LKIAFFAALVAYVFWVAPAFATQHIKIYKHTGTEFDEVSTPMPSHSDNFLIWEDGSCRDGPVARGYCNLIDADAIADDVQEAGQKVGFVGQPQEDGSSTIHVIVHDDGAQSPAYTVDFYSILLPITAKDGWKYGTGSHNGVIQHEMGHAFFDKQVRSKTCKGGACTESTIEHWGLDEGISMILQELLSSSDVGDAPADSVQDIMADCSIYDAPNGGQDCAHDLGRLLVESFDALASEKTPNQAFAYYRDVVIHDLTHDELSDFAKFHEHLGQLIYKRDIRPEVEKEPPPGEALTFELPPWRFWLELFFRSGSEKPPEETIPHGS